MKIVRCKRHIFINECHILSRRFSMVASRHYFINDALIKNGEGGTDDFLPCLVSLKITFTVYHYLLIRVRL